MRCTDCGGEMVGDGYTTVYHCEYSEEADYEYHAPDEGPVMCGFLEEE